MQFEVMFLTVKYLLTFLIVQIVSSQVQSRKHRRDAQILQNDTPVQDNIPQKIENEHIQQVKLQIPVQSNAENVQLITTLNHKPHDEENVQQIVLNDPRLQEVTAEVPNTDGSSVNKPDDPNLKLQGSLKAKVATDKVQHVQEMTAAQWPMGVVPYAIDEEIYDEATIRRIVQAMSVVESSSCVLFKELKEKPSSKSSNSWLYITNPRQERECVHETSTTENGGIMVVLGIECLHPDEIVHSMLHGIGFKDEVSHPHRDQYIRIMWENIQPKYRPLFRIQYEDAPYKLVEYDPLSIMHFHDRAFSINGAATISPRISGLRIGSSGLSRQTLSQLDIMKLKLAFGHECNKRKIGDLLDTCKKALLPKEIDEYENPANTSEEHDTDTYEEDNSENV